MAQKGSNTIVIESRKEITNAINEGLKKLPVAVIAMIVESALVELNDGLNKTLESENNSYQEQIEIENKQVEHISECEC